MNKKVLLTGISGYIGLHCAKILLEKGYTVVGTVRSTKKEEEVIKTLNSNSVSIENLSFTHLDLSSDKGWDSALSNCNYVMHVASPFTVENPKNESDMLGPAVDGTLRVLKAAKKNGVKRVVLTSSMVALMGGKNGSLTGYLPHNTKIFREKDMDYQHIIYEESEKIGTMTLNRPEKRNALGQQADQETTLHAPHPALLGRTVESRSS